MPLLRLLKKKTQVPTSLFEVSIYLIGVPNCPGADLSWYRNVSHRCRSVLVPKCLAFTHTLYQQCPEWMLQCFKLSSQDGTQYSCNVFPSQSRNWNRNNMLKKTKNTPFNGYSLQGLKGTTLCLFWNLSAKNHVIACLYKYIFTL